MTNEQETVSVRRIRTGNQTNDMMSQCSHQAGHNRKTTFVNLARRLHLLDKLELLKNVFECKCMTDKINQLTI